MNTRNELTWGDVFEEGAKTPKPLTLNERQRLYMEAAAAEATADIELQFLFEEQFAA